MKGVTLRMCMLLAWVAACEDVQRCPYVDYGAHFSGWGERPHNDEQRAMNGEWVAYCAIPRQIRHRSEMTAVLAVRYRLVCHEAYPDDDRDVCAFLTHVGAMRCDYVRLRIPSASDRCSE